MYLLFCLCLALTSPSFITHPSVVRVVVDEAHTSFMDISYRTVMESLRHLNLATVQRIFLTGTLSPNHEEVLAKHVGISLPQTLVLRSSTARPNHLIQVVGVASRSLAFKACIQAASLLLARWKDDRSARGIVFVRSLAALDSFHRSATFRTWTYSGTMADGDKDRQLTGWISGESSKWMVATTALLHGLDYPRVDAVLFLESPYGLYEFIQGAGRAGRSGQKALVAIIHESPLPTNLPSDNEHNTEEAMGMVIQASTCRRAAISLVMDAASISCAELPGSVPCDACEGHLDPLMIEAVAGTTQAPPIAAGLLHRPPSTASPIPIPATATGPSRVTRPPSPARLPQSLSYGNVGWANPQHRHESSATTAFNLIVKYSGCFACRIVHSTHQPCHDACGTSGISACLEKPHIPFTCAYTLEHRNGWIEWKRSLNIPKGPWRCYFCWLPKGGFPSDKHVTKDLPHNVRCRYADSLIVAAWHVLNTPELIEGIQEELNFVPGSDLPLSFGEWLMGYSSGTDPRLFSVFVWLCNRFYPENM